MVEFKIDLGLSVVPTNWISSIGGIDLCPYPDPPPKDFYKLQSNKDSLPKDGWTNLEVTCVKTSSKLSQLNSSIFKIQLQCFGEFKKGL